MSTTTLTATAASTSSVMLPSDPADSICFASRVVRFDSECVLIPESQRPSRRPRMVTKSYSLPLWKKKPQQSISDSELVEEHSGAVPPSPSGDKHVVFKVPLPSFARKSSRSPNRGRPQSSSPPAPKPLSPCLVHRSPLTAPTSPRHLPTPPHSKEPGALTVPLRACCPDCVPITEESLKEGSLWQEKFTRGARRRRSSSLDESMSSSRIPQSRVDVPPVATPASRFSITVDEVDKRRKSQEFTEGDIREHLAASSPLPSPSPRRSPNASPSPSRNVSPSHSLTPSPANSASPSPVPSPNASTSCLGAPAATDGTRPSQLLPPVNTQPTLSASPLPSPSIISAHLRASSSLPESKSPSKSKFSPTDPKPASPLHSPTHQRAASTPPPSRSNTVPVFDAPASPKLSKFKPKSPPIAIPTKPSASPSSSSSPKPSSTSPSSPKTMRLLPRSASILRAGADVLKGVSSMGGGAGAGVRGGM
ncbi:hypothetical protein BD779DRAFT_1571188 [Infundibulicybe gibba]|nr:hypothetical protein BD779DRAFT_1571188 [Infundibulicybe gibba]